MASSIKRIKVLFLIHCKGIAQIEAEDSHIQNDAWPNKIDELIQLERVANQRFSWQTNV
jgi:hypothetical protein